MATLNELVDQIREKEKLILKNEAASVPLIIDQARLMVEFRTKARKNWEDICKQRLRIHPRVARRLVKVGEMWSTPDRTPGSELLAKLPTDLHKLEALCQLSLDQLKKLSGQVDLRKREREDVIARVKALAGGQPQVVAAPNPLGDLLNRWDSFVARIKKDVKSLDDVGRQGFAEELENLMSQLRGSAEGALKSKSTTGGGGMEDEDVDETEQEEGGEEEEIREDAEEAEDAKEEKEPASKVPGPKGTAGRTRNKPQPA